MRRAVGASEPPGAPAIKPQASRGKVPPPAAVQLKDTTKPATPQKTASLSPDVQKKDISAQNLSTAVMSGKPEAVTSSLKMDSPTPDSVTPKDIQKSVLKKQLDPTSQLEQKQGNATPTAQRESGLVDFSGTKSQPDKEKPAESVAGKMFGFGSSIFSSASTLVTSAVQDQPKTTPPVSPKMSPGNVIKSPAAQKKKPDQPQEQPKTTPPVSPKMSPATKLDLQKKTDSTQQTVTPTLGQAKVDEAPSLSPKAAAATQLSVKPGQSTCPLCKVELNMALPNYNTCTECKNTVCNQCGFNPMPNEKPVRLNKYLFF